MENEEREKKIVAITKTVRHSVNLKTGRHRQWVIEKDGTKREIFKGDEEWEE